MAALDIVSQVIVITLPIIGMALLILILNVVAPLSHDVRVINYVVPVVPPRVPCSSCAAGSPWRSPRRSPEADRWLTAPIW